MTGPNPDSTSRVVLSVSANAPTKFKMPHQLTRSTSFVLKDLTISFYDPADPENSPAPDVCKWHRIDKDLHLHSTTVSAWLYLDQVREQQLARDDLIIYEIKTGRQNPTIGTDGNTRWEERPAGIWLLRGRYADQHHRRVIDIDVLFGKDAVEPRCGWTLSHDPLLLQAPLTTPVARLTVQQGATTVCCQTPRLQTNYHGKFKVLQVSDTHMVTGPGTCKDAIDANGRLLPEIEADPKTVAFLEEVVDVERPDLVILTGDQLHETVLDAQSVILKLVAPLIKRSIPYAAIFGNHDDEGPYAMDRKAQMALLQSLPFSLCQPGPSDLDGVGNYYLRVHGNDASGDVVATLYLIDSHSELKTKVKQPDYRWVQQCQLDWFVETARSLRSMQNAVNSAHLAMTFMHIPLPEYGEKDLIIAGGSRGEPTEAPSFNSRFYSALASEGVVVVGAGHDHVNDFCALRPVDQSTGPWLCYAGGAGFGGYGKYGRVHYHRRMRILDIDSSTGTIKTWKRMEYANDPIDEIVLVRDGRVVTPPQV